MRKIVFGFFTILFIVPLWADTYTRDYRKPVTQEMWKTEPYKYVLKMGELDDGWVFCTANMVAGKIVTAMHCVKNKDGSLKRDLRFVEFTPYDGKKIHVDPSLIVDGGGWNGQNDWAILTPIDRQDFVMENSIKRLSGSSNFVEVDNIGKEIDFMTIGCGALKIMSDEEIERFQLAYLAFVRDHLYGMPDKEPIDGRGNMWQRKQFDFVDEEGIDSTAAKFFYYFSEYADYYNLPRGLFTDTATLKVTPCIDQWKGKDELYYCQAWGGNSGGGAYSVPTANFLSFYDKNVLNSTKGADCVPDQTCMLGILVSGPSAVGGDKLHHVGGYNWFVGSGNYKKKL